MLCPLLHPLYVLSLLIGLSIFWIRSTTCLSRTNVIQVSDINNIAPVTPYVSTEGCINRKPRLCCICFVIGNDISICLKHFHICLLTFVQKLHTTMVVIVYNMHTEEEKNRRAVCALNCSVRFQLQDGRKSEKLNHKCLW